MPQYSERIEHKGMDLNHDFYVVCKQCRTENAQTVHQYNILIIFLSVRFSESNTELFYCSPCSYPFSNLAIAKVVAFNFFVHYFVKFCTFVHKEQQKHLNIAIMNDKKKHSHLNEGVFLCRNIHLFPCGNFQLFVRRLSTKHIKCGHLREINSMYILIIKIMGKAFLQPFV